jgi:hypothetical protein
MYNAAVKTDAASRYTLKIVHDEDAVNPREDYDNFSKMACWHNRYSLGDKHNFSDPAEFLKQLVRDTIPEKDIIAFAKDGKGDGLTLEYNKSGREWELKTYDDYFKKWYEAAAYPAPLDMESGVVSENIIENLRDADLMTLAERTHLIMPLYFYDHSIQSISTNSFVGRAHHAEWDSGQVGWVYAGHADIAKEFGDASTENTERAERLMNAETETYDCYLRGDCYGFRLYRDGEETDSCWGFLGNFNEAKDAIREYLPEDAVPLADSAEYGVHDPDYDPEDNMEQGDDG